MAFRYAMRANINMTFKSINCICMNTNIIRCGFIEMLLKIIFPFVILDSDPLTNMSSMHEVKMLFSLYTCFQNNQESICPYRVNTRLMKKFQMQKILSGLLNTVI